MSQQAKVGDFRCGPRGCKRGLQARRKNSLDIFLCVCPELRPAQSVAMHLSLCLLKNSQASGCFSVAASPTGTPSEPEPIG